MRKNESDKSALELVDGRRRGFLGKLLAGGAAAAALPMTSTVAFGAEQAQGGGKGKGGKGKGGKGAKGGGQGQDDAAQRDPKAMAARLIKEHDKDGDGALNVTELEAALKAMQKRRENMGDGGADAAGKGKGGGGKGKGGKGKGGSTAPGGGVKPKKPGN